MNNLKLLLLVLTLSIAVAGCASEEVVEVSPAALKGTPTSKPAQPGQGAAGQDITAPR